MTNFYDWSETASVNGASDETINFAEFQNPDTVNDSARALMARMAQWRKDNAPTRTSTGTGNAYAVTSQAGGSTSYQDGEIVTFIADRANTGACTLNVNSRGAVAFRPAVGVAFSANEIQANQPVMAFYRSASNEWLGLGTGYHVNALTSGLLTQSIAARLLKIGTPVLSIAPSAPTGYIRLTEATQTLNKSDWPELSSWLSALSSPYPWGSTSTTFSLPPAAGYVLRFAATSSSIDTSGARTAGSTQSDQNKAHTHAFSATTASDGAHTHTVNGSAAANAANGGDQRASVSSQTTSSSGTHTHVLSGTTDSSGGDEIRVKNVAMHVDIFASSQLSAGTIGMFGWPFSWDTGTSSADPGTARVRGNHATMASITALYINETDGWGVNIGPLLSAFEPGDTIRLSKIGSQANTLVATVSSTITDVGSYRSIPITVLVANGSFASGDTLALELTGGVGAAGTTVPDISGLSEDTANDDDSDYLIEYDSSAAAHKKVKPKNLGFTQASGTRRGLQSKLRETVSLTDFGAIGDGSTGNRATNDTAISSALSYLSGVSGGRLLAPAGHFQFATQIDMPSNVIIQGDGYNTTFNFSGLASGSGFRFNNVNNSALRNFLVRNSTGDGIKVQGTTCHDLEFSDIDIASCVGNGMSVGNLYSSRFVHVVSKSNTARGFRIDGYTDQLRFVDCIAGNNGSDGYYVNNSANIGFLLCDAGSNTGYGWNVTNVNGLTIIGGSNENNTVGSFVAAASSALASGSTVADIIGMVVIGTYVTTNGTTGPSVLEAASSNSRTVDVTLAGVVDGNSPSGFSLRANGVTLIKKWGGSLAGSHSLSDTAAVNDILDLRPAANKVGYYTAAGASALADFTAAGRTLAGLSGIGTGVDTFITTPSSANLKAALTDETGSGAAVFATSPALTTPNIGTPSAGTLTNCSGLPQSGVTLANDLAALEALSSTGIAVRTASDTWAQRTITGTAAEIDVANGNGVSGNPTLSLPTALTFTSKTVTGGTFASVTLSGTTTFPLGSLSSGSVLSLGDGTTSGFFVKMRAASGTGQGALFGLYNSANTLIGMFGQRAAQLGSGTSEDTVFSAQGARGFYITTNGADAAYFNSSNYAHFPGHRTTASAANAFLDSGSTPAGELLRSTSSATYKRQIETLDFSLALNSLRLEPKWYRSNTDLCTGDNPDWSHFGFIAEEAEIIEPRLVHKGYQDDQFEMVDESYVLDGEQATRKVKRLKEGAQKRPDGFQYERLTVLHHALLQELYARKVDGQAPAHRSDYSMTPDIIATVERRAYAEARRQELRMSQAEDVLDGGADGLSEAECVERFAFVAAGIGILGTTMKQVAQAIVDEEDRWSASQFETERARLLKSAA